MKNVQKRVSFSAIRCQQNRKEFFVSSILSNILEQSCYIVRRASGQNKGFQRILNESRAKNIASYLDKEGGVIPSALILSAQDVSDFEFDDRLGRISFDVVDNSFMVIDGQHRLYGYNFAKENYEVPVVIFKKLTVQEEFRLFIDINTTQKGVPSALLLDIKDLAGRETKREEKQRDLFDLLNKSSIMAGLLSANKSISGKISRSTFNEATNVIFDNGPLKDQDITIIYKAIKNYLEAFSVVFANSGSQMPKLSKAIFFRAAFILANEVMDNCLKANGNLKTASLLKIVEPLSEVQYDNYVGSNRATVQRLVTDMRRELERSNKRDINDGMF